jgi:hypothetical protein
MGGGGEVRQQFQCREGEDDPPERREAGQRFSHRWKSLRHDPVSSADGFGFGTRGGKLRRRGRPAASPLKNRFPFGRDFLTSASA